MLGGAFKVKRVKAIGAIYIRVDGSVDPPTASIQRDADLYTLTGNITSDTCGIVIERDNVTLDGAGYTVQKTQASYHKGICMSGRSNVTIKNIKVKAFYYGILLDSSSNNNIFKSNITGNKGSGIVLSSGCQYNSIIENNIIANEGEGIFLLRSSDYQKIVGNNITANIYGISLYSSSKNSIYGNNITNNNRGIHLHGSSDNWIYHNNFVNNTNQVYTVESINIWDDGYPSSGNYWSNYTGLDSKRGVGQNLTGSDGIGDTPYVIDRNNRDRYPLMTRYIISEFSRFLILPLFMAATLLTVIVFRRKRARGV